MHRRRAHRTPRLPSAPAARARQGVRSFSNLVAIKVAWWDLAVRRGIPIRVGIIDCGDEQRVAEAEADLHSLGVTRISTDRVRGIGRAAAGEAAVDELCGHCGRGIAAVTADGTVRPCVMSRWMSAGGVREQPLAEILVSERMRELIESIPGAAANPCNPDKTGCKPKKDGGDCQPAEKPACNPKHK